ncbi:universal stress protein [Desulfurispira natronophila]|uniref:Nucleotide-binding universal stress UspA family protein n=1 Tax=Desulfurispira natronophila TaxID=682562 RepID=A0A7W7Y3J8_9BACT|nr:universal stress protein [Desulfurispira natronophila]MBB5021440.1 nucleotide-binding universal stress UspA family protein [Desulfurispira natronophila]
MKPLVAATDLTRRGQLAVERGLLLSRQLNCPLRIVHVVDEELPAELIENHRELAQLSIESHLQNLKDVPECQVDVIIGRGSSTIRQYAQQHQAVAILTGQHRELRFMDSLRGSTVERILRHADLPVFIAKAPPVEPYQRLLIAMDFSVYSRRAVEFVFRYFPQADLSLVHAFEPPFAELMTGDGTEEDPGERHERELRNIIYHELRSFIGTFDIHTRPLNLQVLAGNPTDILMEKAAVFRPDLIVVGTHARAGIAQALLGSVAQSILRRSPCDVLTVKAW